MREIALRLGLTPNAVSTRLSRASVQLRELLQRDDPELADMSLRLAVGGERPVVALATSGSARVEQQAPEQVEEVAAPLGDARAMGIVEVFVRESGSDRPAAARQRHDLLRAPLRAGQLRGEVGDVVARSKIDGSFVVPYASSMQMLSASAEGYAASRMCAPVMLATEREDKLITLLLGTASGGVRGRVVDGNDQGVPCALVVVGGAPRASIERDDSGATWGPPQRILRTDQAGRFELVHLPAGSYSLAVSVAGRGSMDVPLDRPLEVDERRVLGDIEFTARDER